ncbi:Methylenetetrahydrofolate--tRNA-(uracil-5-)-methyltransferase TrmFO [compost metagenome]
MTGVEGYVESAASGLAAGMNAARLWHGQEPLVLPADTSIGSMAHYIVSTESGHFQPMNANFGLLPPLEERIKNKKLKYEKLAERALQTIQNFVGNLL